MAAGQGSICILPRLSGLGGPVSFQGRLIQGLQARGYTVHHDPTDLTTTTLLVIGGTQQIVDVWHARRRGVRIVQRLNGMNWIHRKRKTGLRHALRAERNNWVLATIRRRLADHVVYQSQFARTWWQTVYGGVPGSANVIYNGVDLDSYTPQGPHRRPQDVYRLLLVEGHLRGGYEQGLETAVQLGKLLQREGEKPCELVVVGDVPRHLQEYWQRQATYPLTWAGVTPRDAIPEIDRSAHVLFSADLNAACPNSVVEALACGLPVVAYATGSLPELVGDEGGLVVPYGSNYWNLEAPDIPALAAAAQRILQEPDAFRQGARRRAEAAFGLEAMIDAYLEALAP
ncbi:MAG: glycosyltransferase family 4 protein [Chloroflexi bacterium]|nr:glycosyltransferase family 4 protein [Anaerolineaceae bacterium]NMB89815.1 glycosyltransferase family 4 protein [Chloroflexota bacterium]